ncbi:MAG: hypothetical protein EOP00_00400 [Pedobacter sp.]|nr:MAG: hypothetical protein EOP00_00400 [Pedobacter sp.]
MGLVVVTLIELFIDTYLQCK